MGSPGEAYPTQRLTQWDLEQMKKQQAEEMSRTLFSFAKHEVVEDHELEEAAMALDEALSRIPREVELGKKMVPAAHGGNRNGPTQPAEKPDPNFGRTIIHIFFFELHSFCF